MNDIEANRRGPGRVLDNGFAWAGLRLERAVGNAMYRSGLTTYAKEEKNLAIFDHDDLEGARVNDGHFKTLFGDAGSDNPGIQYMAFEIIVRCFAVRQDKFLQFLRREGPDERVIASWRRREVCYSTGWLFAYNLVSRCLLGHLEPDSGFLGAFASLNRSWDCKVDFSHFEELLSLCREKIDFSVAVELMAWAWNGEGLSAYVERNGYNDQLLRGLANAICRRYYCLFESHKLQLRLYGHFVRFATHFISEMLASTRSLTAAQTNELATRVSVKGGIWREAFKIFQMSKRRIKWDVHPNCTVSLARTWGEECLRQLPERGHTKMRSALMELEVIYGLTSRNRFSRGPSRRVA